MDETELVRISGDVLSNTARIYAVEDNVRTHNALIDTISREAVDHSDCLNQLMVELQEVRETLRGLKRLMDDADNGMYDTEQLLGDVKDLLYGV